MYYKIKYYRDSNEKYIVSIDNQERLLASPPLLAQRYAHT